MEIDPGPQFRDSQRISQALNATGWAWSFKFEGPHKTEAYYWHRGDERLVQLCYPDGRCGLFPLANAKLNIAQAMEWIRKNEATKS